MSSSWYSVKTHSSLAWDGGVLPAGRDLQLTGPAAMAPEHHNLAVSGVSIMTLLNTAALAPACKYPTDRTTSV
jgi:hypothetical protein